MRKGFFGTQPALQLIDVQVTLSRTDEPFSLALSGGWYTINLNRTVVNDINKLTTSSGVAQFRLRFKIDDNNNAGANTLNIISGNNATQAKRPELIIGYSIP
jgi:hypothetical protein